MSSEIKKSKVKLVTDNLLAVIAQIIGTVLIFINSALLITAIIEIFEEVNNTDTIVMISVIIFLLALLIAGIFLLRWGNDIKMLSKTFKNYVCVMSAGSNGKLEYIANIVGENQKKVKSNIEKMINKRYFVNAYIDESKKELIIAGQSLSNANLLEAVNTTCRGCGAVSSNLISEETYCEYCGALL